MPSSNEFQQVHDRDTPDAVTVRIFDSEGETFGEVTWPHVKHGGHFEGPALGELVPVPQALDRAIDAKRRYGLPRIVVYLDDGVAWSDEWGTLNG